MTRNASDADVPTRVTETPSSRVTATPTKITAIKGTVTRIASDSNFFIKPTDPNPETMRYIDVGGHRVGDGEISAERLNGTTPRFRAYKGDLPKLGDEVSLELVTAYEP